MHYASPSISKISIILLKSIIRSAYLCALLADEANADEHANRYQIIPETSPVVDMKGGDEGTDQHQKYRSWPQYRTSFEENVKCKYLITQKLY